jgi:hypothetical protein
MRNDTRTHDNENEPLTFQALGLAAALVINRIRTTQTLRELAIIKPMINETVETLDKTCADNEGGDGMGNSDSPNQSRDSEQSGVFLVKRHPLNPDEEQKEQPGEQPKAGNENEDSSANHLEAVNQRLRDLAAFERRARGVK